MSTKGLCPDCGNQMVFSQGAVTGPYWWCASCDSVHKVEASSPEPEIALNLPTPEEVAQRLKSAFPVAQAEAIAAEVYQPLLLMLEQIALRGVR